MQCDLIIDIEILPNFIVLLKDAIIMIVEKINQIKSTDNHCIE